MRVSAGGSKTFIVLIASGRRQSLGRYPSVTLSKARTRAKEILAEKTLGKIKPTHTAFDDAKEDFLKECGQSNKPRTVRDYKRLLARHYNFGRKSLADITPREIVKYLNQLNAVPSEKHHAFTVGRAFFSWCARQHIIEMNPMDRVYVRPTGTSRERTLSGQELGASLRLALSKPTLLFYSIFALLVLTGQRRSEIAGLQRSWVNWTEKLITLPPSLTKNGREHTFPVGEMTISVLSKVPELKDNPYFFPAARDRYKSRPATVFNGWGKPKAAFDNKLNITPYTLHDLRRTLRTTWAELGISKDVAKKYINHVSGTDSGLDAIYNRYTYLPEMRQAVEKWETHLQALLKS